MEMKNPHGRPLTDGLKQPEAEGDSLFHLPRCLAANYIYRHSN
jgi:hypothetical protein